MPTNRLKSSRVISRLTRKHMESVQLIRTRYKIVANQIHAAIWRENDFLSSSDFWRFPKISNDACWFIMISDVSNTGNRFLSFGSELILNHELTKGWYPTGSFTIRQNTAVIRRLWNVCLHDRKLSFPTVHGTVFNDYGGRNHCPGYIIGFRNLSFLTELQVTLT